ncbi:MAG: peptide deformylase [Planctomycetes bacterium]|nr:peptide deformylase [Planctomycetota bacterium]
MRVGPAEVLQLGDPRLRAVSVPVGDVRDPEFLRQCALLHEVLDAFRHEYGFGRAIAAPQIGIAKRFVAVCLAGRRFTVVDPDITWRSERTFELWDDCMSFPDLLVPLRRHAAIRLRYTDERGRRVEWDGLSPAESELMQHEIDHLDGILAVDRAIGPPRRRT